MTNTPCATPEATAVLASLTDEVRRQLNFTLGHTDHNVDLQYLYRALALATRDRLVTPWLGTKERFSASNQRKVYYLSMEFLMGRSLTNAVQNLDLDESAREALHRYGVELEVLAEEELDAGLGNGGLGRLAACFLDSCANLKLPVVGYGIRYEYGMFFQHVEGGRQVEEPDHWLRDGNPWEIERPEDARNIKFYGHTQRYHKEDSTLR